MAADWVVARVSQPSQFTIDRKTWTALKAGMTVPNRSWISTGPRGRVMLQRNKDQVTFQPGTLAGVFERSGVAVHTDFAQQTGTLSLSIDPQVKPHLAVQTPYLAAVVKGTVFSVTVGKTGASVGVERGRVEVTDPRSGEKTGVKAGQKASVDQDPATPMSLSGVNTNFEAVVSVRLFAPAVPAAAAAIDATHVSATSSDTSVENSSASVGNDTGRGDQGSRGRDDGQSASPQASGPESAGPASPETAERQGENARGGKASNGKGHTYGRDSKGKKSESRGENSDSHDD